MVRASRAADHTAVPAGVLQQHLVKVEAAVCPDGMPAAWWELVGAKKNQLEPRAPLEPFKRTLKPHCPPAQQGTVSRGQGLAKRVGAWG